MSPSLMWAWAQVVGTIETVMSFKASMRSATVRQSVYGSSPIFGFGIFFLLDYCERKRARLLGFRVNARPRLIL